MIPQDFESWHDCITKKCKLALTKDFAQSRLAVYRQAQHPETIEFIRLYGIDHYRRIRSWFERIVNANDI
ncbi:hypothetical protein [Olivibacter sp. XZL3]|uniref:hypothetical protein n=1 Tax=Olivibacter sp. XZL3 TaxID=1735116 RepID=UPI001065BB64|nr:hypothetical protein [Olivibacter sp. XZL3]